MKRLLSRLLLLLALCVPWVAQSQDYGDHIVCRGTATDGYFPVYGNYVDALQHSQVIYPADSLTSLQGMTITSLKWYISTPATQLWGCTFEIKMGISESATLLSYDETTPMTTVYTGQLDGTGSIMEVELDTMFTYTGGNLMVDVHNLNTGTYSACIFLGANLSGRGLTSYSNYTPQDHNFLPTINFFCENLSCPKPSAASVSGITTESAIVTWSSTGSTAYRLSLNGETITVYDTTYTFTGLDDNTAYTVGISALCDSGVASTVREVSFRTACGGVELPLYESFENNGSHAPFCWTILENWMQGSYAGFGVTESPTSVHSGVKGAQLIAQIGPVSIASPLMPIDPDDVEVFFWAMGTDNTTFEVGYVTSLEENATFHLVKSVNISTVMHKYYVSFAEVEETNSIYVVFREPYFGTYQFVYLDDIMIRESRSCHMPQDFAYVSSDDGSVTLNWNDDLNTAWQIAYGIAGCNPDSATIIQEISAAPYTVTNLQNNVVYDFYLRSDCGGDVSWWTDSVRAKPNTYLMPTSGFDTLYSCGMTIADNGGVGGDYGANSNGTLILYPASEDSIVHLTGSYTINSGDMLYIYDGAERTRVLIGSYSGFGNINVASTVGPLSLRFTSDNSNNAAGFELMASCEPKVSCIHPYNLAIGNIGVVSALASWSFNPEGGSPIGYYVTVTNLTTMASTSQYADTTFFQIEGLDASTNYSVSVRTICQSGDTSDAISITFTTKDLPCGGSDESQTQTVSLMTGTRVSTVIPLLSSYGNSISQQIYRVEEMNNMGRITGMKFRTSAGNNARNIRVYLGTTPNVSLTAFEAPADQTLVWTGSISYAPDSIYTLTFSTPFNYSGTDNLLLTIIDYTGSSSYGDAVYTHANGNNYSRYYYSQTSFDAFNPPVAGYQTIDRMNVEWLGNPCNASATCVAPIARVTDLAANSLTLYWTAGYTETAWKVEYQEQNADSWTLVEDSTFANNYDFTGLQANTNYLFRISSLCSGNQSLSTVLQVTTPCAQISTFPFVEDFDNGFVGTIAQNSPFQSCWNRLYNGGYSAFPYVYSSMSYTGSSCLYFASTSASGYAVAVLPESSVPVNNLQLSLTLIRTGANYSINVGVMDDPDDYNSITQVITLSPSTTNVWETFDVNFHNYTGTGRYIVLSVSGVNYIGVDHLVLDYLPTCDRPTGITVDTVIGTTATLHWTATQATDYEIEYGPQGFALGEGELISSETASVTLTNLASSTIYEVYVRGNCGVNGYSEWSFATSFATECGKIESLPYYENFNSWIQGASPLCWDKAGNQFPWVSRYDDRFDNGCAYSFDYAMNYDAEYYFSLPELDSTIDMSQVQIAMSLLSSHESGIVVGVCSRSGDMTSFVTIDTIVHVGDGEWHDYVLPIGNYTGSARYLTFKAYVNYAYGGSITMDEFSVEYLPTCPKADTLTAFDATATSVVLGWYDAAGASEWQIEYGVYDPETRQVFDSTLQRVIVTSNPFTLTGLTPNTLYSYHVRPICSATDTGAWNHDAGRFNTSQVVASLPYSYDFETAAEWDNWTLLSDFDDLDWYRGTADAATGSYGMYISADGGATVSTHQYVELGPFNYVHPNMVAYRDFDFGATDTNITLSFIAKCGGIPSGNTDGLAVFVVDPVQTFDVSNAIVTSPWGAVEDLDVAVSIHADTNWQTYEVEFSRVHGIKRLVFYFYNDFVGPNFIGTPAVVDNISIFQTSCPRPSDVEVVSATSTTMDVTWWGDASAQYEVRYAPFADETDVTLVPVSTNSVTLTGLNAGAQYNISVRKICGEGDSSIFTEPILGHTECFDGVISNFPWVEDFENGISCWSQEQLTGSNSWTTGTLYTNNPAYSGSVFAVMTHLDHGCKTMLVSPAMNIIDGAYMTFAHKQESRLGSQDTLGIYYRTSDTSAWVYITSYIGNISNWQVDSVALPNASHTYQVGFLAYDNYGNGVAIDKVFFYSDGCPVPVVSNVATTYNSFTVDWTGTNDNYEVSYKTLTDADYCEPIALTDASYTLNRLMPATQYSFRLRQVCDVDMVSDWTTVDVITDSLPCYVPTNLSLSELGYQSVTIDWTNGGDEQLWVVKVFNSRIGELFDTVSAHPVSYDNLASGEQYYVTVQAACGSYLEGFSDWSDTISFTTTECVPVSNIQCGTPTDSYVQISWTANGSESAWIVEYGMPGFGQGEEMGRATATSNPYQLSLAGFDPETDYEVYVYAQCMEGLTSVPTGPASFRTNNIGISGISGTADINIYPNPTTGSTTISVSGISGKVNVAIVDMNGREVMNSAMECDGDCEKVMNVEGLAQGAYFVRIYGEEINSIRKLIVR